jgi:hypothetical protein
VPKFITIGYGDRGGYDRTDAAVRDAAHAHDARLRKAGILMGVEGTPVQVRNTDAKNIETKTGSFMSCSHCALSGVTAPVESAKLSQLSRHTDTTHRHLLAPFKQATPRA